jgi:indole-3-glycerol phosphate synthase
MARTLGASAILLICSLLSQSELEEYQAMATELGMSALVEAHDEREVEMALRAEASIIGVNNRNLKTFTVDINNSARYRKMVPKEVSFVSESGIKTAEDIAKLLKNGTDAVLIGETLMRSENKKQALDELRGI